jgi:beta-fructofuranosidase
MRNNLFVALLITASVAISSAQEPTFHLGFNEPSGTVTTTELVSGTTFQLFNAFDRPERIPANFGHALRLDGYSTYLRDPGFPIQSYSSQLTVEAWYATEAFTFEPGAIIHSQLGNNGFKLQVNAIGSLAFSFSFNGQLRNLVTNRRLTPYRWHHIVVVVDGIAGKVTIYVDNESWLSSNFSPNATLDAANTTLWVGKSALNQVFSGFSLNTLNGALDELKVYNTALTANQIAAHFAQATQLEAALSIDPNVRHAGDYLRPRYHPMPNTSWTNEPYGLTYYGGKYHLFFQKNPNGPYLYFMHWGHLSSPDLVTWTEEPIALAPFVGFDNFGVWSGTTAFAPNGEPTIFYTGVNGISAGIGMARPLDQDLRRWQRVPNNPVIPSAPGGFPHLDFRDPYIFQRNGLYYMVVGSGLANNGGGILFTYTSTDLNQWTPVQPIFSSTDVMRHGTFWEMPAFFPVNDNDYVFVVTPLFQGQPADVIYWVGSFDGQVFTPYDLTARNFELIGQNLLAPAIGRDQDGQWTSIGIIPDDRAVDLQIEAGWRHVFSLPRQLRLLDDHRTLAAIPHPHLCRLRLDSVVISNRNISANTQGNLSEFQSNQAELVIDIRVPPNGQTYVDVFKSENNQERTSIILDRLNGQIGLDRSVSSPYATVENIRYQNYTFNTSGIVKLRIFLDRSVIEVFVDDTATFSARAYPGPNSNRVDVRGLNSPTEILSFKGYPLGDKENLYPDLVCPTELTSTRSAVPVMNKLPVFPNPVQDQLFLQNEGLNPTEVIITDLYGRIQDKARLEGNVLHVRHLPSGVYLLTMYHGNSVYVARFIKQ